MKKKLFLFDAFALIFRGYFAFINNPLINSKGQNTSAITGFLNSVYDIINREKPTHLAVVFDTQAPTERHIEYTAYKANRSETPEAIIWSTPLIKQLLQSLNIPIIECDGYEADDVIGTIAKSADPREFDVYMVTPDKDFGQLVSDTIFMYKPTVGKNPHEVLGVDAVCAKWDIVNVNQLIDLLGLMGDAVDNIPGVPGVGEKTATKLIKEYGSMEEIYNNIEKLKGKQKENFEQFKDQAFLSKKLATILLNAPVQWTSESLQMAKPNLETATALFADLELKTLAKRFLGVTNPNPTPQVIDLFNNHLPTIKQATLFDEPIYITKKIHEVEHTYELINDDIAFETMFTKISDFITNNNIICFDTETTGIDANQCELVGLSFAIVAHEAYYVPCPADKTEALALLNKFNIWFQNIELTWIGQNIKYDLLVLKNYGITLAGSVFDTMIAAYNIAPEARHSMDVLSEKYLDYTPISIEQLIGKKGKSQGNMRDVPLDKITQYAAEDADITLQLHALFKSKLKEKEVEKVFYEVDNKLVKTLVDMEYAGIRIDEEFLKRYSLELTKDAKIEEEKVYEIAGVKFNLASPKQLGEVLFDKLKLDPKAKTTKTGQYQTGEDVLTKLATDHAICNHILDFRELTKLQNTYVDALPQMINPKTGRVHTSFNQTIAVTGRLSSTSPNLQNIPIRTNKGKEIRKAFIPQSDNHVLISADYSQIELRIVAAISGDEAMCKAFKNQEDIHIATAAKVFGVSLNEVTKEMRYKAKSVNFGIIYGQGAFGLADNLGISRSEAKEIIDNYKKEFSAIQLYMDQTIASARNLGYVQTIMGRKRWLTDINASNFNERSFAERNAINSPIQGSAADMIKLAMIIINQKMKTANMQSRMVLQVHDELVFDALKSEVDDLKKILLDGMQNAMPLPNGVPTVAEVGIGNNWLEAH